MGEGFENCGAIIDRAKRRRTPDRGCEKALSYQ